MVSVFPGKHTCISAISNSTYEYPTFCNISSKYACRLMVDMPTYTKLENSNLIKEFMFFCTTLKFSNLSVNSSVMKRSNNGLLKILGC